MAPARGRGLSSRIANGRFGNSSVGHPTQPRVRLGSPAIPVTMAGRPAAGLAGQPAGKPGFACTATGAAGLRELPGRPDSDGRPRGLDARLPARPTALKAAADRRGRGGVPKVADDGQRLAP
jgi:hypothetical protein